ncbi:MAG: DUF6036 family nucleotidyltransferase [Actinomycetota bacterium]
MDTTPGWGSAALRALSEQLQDSDARFELVVVGGSALVALGLVSRVTRDIDVVGILAQGELVPADPLPEPLVAAGARVARDLGLPPDWLNAGPTALLDFGLPSGFLDRVHRVDVGPSLAVLYADRFDQIHLKLYAMVDQAGGRHEDDLRALTPTPDELLIAARWTRTHDPSPGFRGQLSLALERLGVDDADVE